MQARTGPVPVTVEMLSQPIAVTVQLFTCGTVTMRLDGHKGVPSAANPRSGEIAFLKITKPPASPSPWGWNVTRSLISCSVTPAVPVCGQNPQVGGPAATPPVPRRSEALHPRVRTTRGRHYIRAGGYGPAEIGRAHV